ncbi:uncharacterized protein LOC135463519 [Liolophura sinensis]|uniref:uncharacterized protein LOC135463519 n=1 Tax=Liolophura sinensis TaxID=3198878 RepID=UPI003158EC49
MARFIPGTVANDVNFQVYLLDGVYRWNEDRRRDALTSKGGADPISYDGPLQQAVNKLSSEVPGKTFCPNFVPPKKYTAQPSGMPPVTSASERTIDTTAVLSTGVEQLQESGKEMTLSCEPTVDDVR